MTERRRASLVRSWRAARLRSVRSWTWPKKPRWRPSASCSRGGADEQVEAGPVGPPAAPLDLEGRLGALGGRGPAQVGQDRVAPGLGQVADGAVQQLGLGTAQELAQGAVDPQEAPVEPDKRHPDRGLVETKAEVHPAPLALTLSDE